MLKHIIGQSIFQLIIIITLVFLGDQFIPEYPGSYDTTVFAGHPEYKWLNGVVGGTVRSGRFYTIKGDKDYSTVYDATSEYSRHFTFIFNTFVMMQVFNFLNSRKLHEEVHNPLFSLTSSRESQEMFCFLLLWLESLSFKLY
jgi:Ca2+ transporting ATPase